MSKPSIVELLVAVDDVDVFIGTVKNLLRGDLTAEDLDNARSELANASNAIDDAMGEIDRLLAPPRTREESYDS